MKKPDLRTRIEHYKLVLAHYDHYVKVSDYYYEYVGSPIDTYATRLCMIFAAINGISFANTGCPWGNHHDEHWSTLRNYYPELPIPEPEWDCESQSLANIKIRKPLIKASLALAEKTLSRSAQTTWY